MLTFIAFLLTLTGCANWMMIGLLQYDFIAGLFGWQGSMLSRLSYILIGIGATYLLVRVIVNKGSVKVFERKKKKEEKTAQLTPQTVNAETSSEQLPAKKKKWWQFWKKKEIKQSTKYVEPTITKVENSKKIISKNTKKPEETNSTSGLNDSLFDEHLN